MRAAHSLPSETARPVIHRTRGLRHGPITRLMSPSDLGEVVKPFVFLDLFDNEGGSFNDIGGLHPHSGIATLTYVAEGSIRYEDTDGSGGLLTAGGVEWMRAGGGIWHGGGPGKPERTRGFQLWIALPPSLELGPSHSVYQDPATIRSSGPARVLLGQHDRAIGSITPPSSINYLAIRLKRGERWRYQPPTGHTVLWIATAAGVVAIPDQIHPGELAVFEPSNAAVEFRAQSDCEFVLGSAVRHEHDLVLGYYSVHTSAEALREGESRISQIRQGLVAAGRLSSLLSAERGDVSDAEIDPRGSRPVDRTGFVA
jgi:redox-sensitive bicupin YhaK (pirin superfamily)